MDNDDKKLGFEEFLKMLAAANVAKENRNRVFRDLAHTVRDIYEALLDEGFTPDQAIELTKGLLPKG